MGDVMQMPRSGNGEEGHDDALSWAMAQLV
jgi:hypothetical protein